MTYKFPKDFLYADTHEYIKKEDEFLKIGISEFAVDQLGDIVFVELSEKGSSLQKGDTFGTIESVKAVEEVYLPFTAKIIERNDNVIDNPEILQNDPIDQGWLLIVQPLEDYSLDDLMNSEEYQSKVAPN
tara:strand:+ start:1073 stop:1462 length:390 start_codon:yes stop_codon:yes gene_type:complete